LTPRSGGRFRPRTVVIAGVLAVLLVAGCVSADHSVHLRDTTPGRSTTTEPGSTTPEPLGRYHLTAWKDCDDGLECATLRVPLDWSDPGGRTVTLAVARKPAEHPDERIGSVVFNPGGPGEPGTDFLRQIIGADRVPSGLGDRFDLVSWDPRGTGGSDGIACLTDQEAEQPDPDPTIDSPADSLALQTLADQRLARCLPKMRDVITRVGTRNTVRDLDALRGALGDRKLTYVGYSYGTTIGIEYGAMFPKRLRAMVLDGVAMPATDPVSATHAQARSFEHNLDAFLDDCEQRALCLFGNGDPRKAFTDLVAQLETGKRLPADYTLPDSHGTAHRRRGTAGIGELYSAVLVSLYAKENWVALETGLAAAERGSGQLLLALRDTIAGRREDGTWSHLPEANQAISCADQEERATDADGDDALRAQWSAELPLLGSVFATGTPGCYGYPKPNDPLTPVTAADLADVPPIVVIGSSEDPATPYESSQKLHGLLPHAALVTWESADHTAYGRGSDCLDDPVTAYLEGLILPRDGLRCRP
jgi:pimeloyl-ACP methyl ester carboxylesterase